MHRRPKVQFKPKIQQAGDRSKAAPASVPEPSASDGKTNEIADATSRSRTTVELVSEDDVSDVGESAETLEIQAVTTEGTNAKTADETTSAVSSLLSDTDLMRPPLPISNAAVASVRPLPLPIVSPIIEKHFKVREHVAKEKAKEPGVKRAEFMRRPKICLASKKGNAPLDKSKVTMFDLLSYNPPLNDVQKERLRKENEDDNSSVAEEAPPKSPITDLAEEDKEDEPEESGPRVKIGANGEIIIDEESLVVKKPSLDDGTTVLEGKNHQRSSLVTYASFRNRPTGKKPRWSDEETLKFYRALSTVGTDFSMMADLIFKGERTRLDLRNKFKKEEKVNRKLVDKALGNSDIRLMQELESSDSDESELNSAHALAENENVLEEPVSVPNVVAQEVEISVEKSPTRKRRGKEVSENESVDVIPKRTLRNRKITVP